MYVVQSLERSPEEGQQHASPEEDDEEHDIDEAALGQTNHASSREYAPHKSDCSHTRASVSLRTVISEACSPTLSMFREDGTGMCCLQFMWEISRVPGRALVSFLIGSQKEGGGQQRRTVAC
jgi:hypothetical protein